MVDYRSLLSKNQLLRNTQAAYEMRNEELSRNYMQQSVKIKQLEFEMEQARVSKGVSMPAANLFESEQFRRDVNRNQELNHIIDSKNKDIAFLRQQVGSVDVLYQENQELRAQLRKLNGNPLQVGEVERNRAILIEKVSMLERQNKELQRENARLREEQEGERARLQQTSARVRQEDESQRRRQEEEALRQQAQKEEWARQQQEFLRVQQEQEQERERQ
jgi:hypothetical protein